MTKNKFYDWPRIFSYQTGTTGEVVLVIGGRGIGKTYGIRKQCVKDFINKKSRFVEICRYSEELKTVQNGYFDKFEQNNEFPNHLFKTEANKAYIAEKVSENEKPDWELLGYFVSLTSQQVLKKTTFANVRRIIFDECVLDRNDKYHHYLPNEFNTFANVISTILREIPGEETNANIYLLGNACDLLCPYLQNLGINKPPEFGIHFYNSKSVLLHYVEPFDAEERKTNTLVGRLLSRSKEAETMFDNKFYDGSNEYIEAKTSSSKFAYAVAFMGDTFGIWVDRKAGLYFVTKQVPNNENNIWSLTRADNKIDYHIAKKTEKHLKALMELYYLGAVRYDSPVTREQFGRVLSYLGIN